MTKILSVAAAAALLHITPTVVLVKRPDAVKQLLPGATTYFARQVRFSEADAHRLHEAVDWSPDEGVLTFYTGKAGATAVGALLFVRVDSPHGPVEVAVGFGLDGAIRGVLVTKATVETKPWVTEALAAGLAERYTGLRPGAAPAGARPLRGRAGALAVYMAEQVDKGVTRALAAYGGFYRS